MNESLSEEEIIKALERSGYLFESETARTLTEMGFFIETNQTIKDLFTNKSREIDIIAEYHNYYPEHIGKKCNAKVKFVFEIKNNILPVVLLTQYQFSPTLIFEDSFKIGLTFPTSLEYKGYDSETDFTCKLCPVTEPQTIFTQYCSFQKKKQNEELMAIHPEELYSGLSKITQYAEEQLEIWENRKANKERKEEYYRNTLFLPVVLLNNDLYELEVDEENKTKLKRVVFSRMIFNYHYKDEQKSCMIYFVTKAGLRDFLGQMTYIEQEIEKSMVVRLYGDG